jgi:PhnB protein
VTGGVPTPPGYGRLAPWVISADTAAEIDFLTAVFDAVETPGARFVVDGRIGHAEVALAGTTVMLFDAGPDWAPTPSHIRVYVADVRGTLAAAEARGARIVSPATEMPFGDIAARFRDPQGHLWWVHQHVEDVPPEEMVRRFGEPRYADALAAFGQSLIDEMGPRAGSTSSG